MEHSGYAIPVQQARRFFNNSTRLFREEDSDYAPVAGQFTVAQHVAHAAQTIAWFMAGGFGDGFDLDFAAHQSRVREVASLAEARRWFENAIDDCIAILDRQNAETMLAPMLAGPIMAGEPRAAVVGAICEHTAHHRGALSVYARLLGYAPPIPYTD